MCLLATYTVLTLGLLVAVGTLPQKTWAGETYYSYEDGQGTLNFTDEPPAVPYHVRVHKISIQETLRVAIRKLSRSELKNLISEFSDEYNVEAPLIEAVIKAESAYDPLAVSHKGARGLMQLMPATADWLGVTDIHNPRQNIRGGVKYLQRLLRMYNGNLDLAAAAYNAGEGAVNRYKGVPPYPETIDYVAKVRKYYNAFRERTIQHASRNDNTATKLYIP